MEKTIRFEVTIERDIDLGMYSKIEIKEALFTKYENLLYPEKIAEKLTLALKLLKGFSTITFDLYECNTDSYRMQDWKVINGKRFTNRTGEIKRAHLQLSTSTYENWFLADKKELFATVKDFVEIANRNYITLLKAA